MVRQALHPDNFPTVFTQMPIEQFKELPHVNIADLQRGRYYFAIRQFENYEILYIIYVCRNYPRIEEILFKKPFSRRGVSWFTAGHDDTYRESYNYFDADTFFYDLTTGFSTPTGLVQLDPESVYPPECTHPPGPISRRLLGLIGRGGRRTKKRTMCDRRTRRRQRINKRK